MTGRNYWDDISGNKTSETRESNTIFKFETTISNGRIEVTGYGDTTDEAEADASRKFEEHEENPNLWERL